MREELASRDVNNSWTLLKRVRTMKVLPSKCVLKEKLLDENNSVIKPRLVVVGSRQEEQERTYASVAGMQTIRVLVVEAAKRNFAIEQLDVKTAYLYGEIDQETFMLQAPGLSEDDERQRCVVSSIAKYIFFNIFHQCLSRLQRFDPSVSTHDQ